MRLKTKWRGRWDGVLPLVQRFDGRLQLSAVSDLFPALVQAAWWTPRTRFRG